MRQAIPGGGISNGGTATVTNSSLSGNAAGYSGGGIQNRGRSTLTVTDSALSGNSARNGGGIHNTSNRYFISKYPSATVTNSTLSGNYASTSGGGIYNKVSRLTVTGSTLTGNSADIGGGVYNIYYSGVVDATDFNVWNENKFTNASSWCRGDFNADGVIDVSDFNAWNNNKFQSSVGTSLFVLPPHTGRTKRSSDPPQVQVNFDTVVVAPSPSLLPAARTTQRIDSVFSAWRHVDERADEWTDRETDDWSNLQAVNLEI